MRQHFREVESCCGVIGSQLWILQEIGNRPGIGVSELAERLSMHQSTCSQLVEKLASRDLICKEHSKEDQRRVGLRLTGQVAAMLKKAPGPAEGILPQALGAMQESALRSLDNALLEVIGQRHMRDDKLAEKPLSEL